MAYKVFTNGSPLPASDLNTYLMNQSVMVFADSTARSAALTAPTEGMTTWLEDTNKLEVYTGAAWVALNSPITTEGDLIIGDASDLPARLPIGTNGQVLTSNGTTATWVTPAGGGSQSWVSLASGAISTGSNNFSVTSFSAYDKYWFAIRQISSVNASARFYLRLNGSSAGNYKQFGYRIESNSTVVQPLDFQSETQFLLGRMGNAAGNWVSAGITINGSQSSGRKQVFIAGAGNGTSTNEYYNTQGIWDNTATITSLQLVSESGNIDAGTYELWGSN
jgi:hypothetical protein